MACLRSILRRTNFSPTQFLPPVRPVPHNNKSDTKTDSLNFFPLTYGLQRLDFLLEERKQTTFSRPVGSGFLLCRYMSSKPGEVSNKVDGLGTVVEEFVPDKCVDAVITQVSNLNEVAVAAADSYLPVAAIQYLIDGVHAFSGLNWWASIVLTTFLIKGLSIPQCIWIWKNTPDLIRFGQRLERFTKLDKVLDEKAWAKQGKEFDAFFDECRPLISSAAIRVYVDGLIYISSLAAIRNMAQKIPSFECGGILWFADLTTPDNLYILPAMMGWTFWLTLLPRRRQKNLVAETRRLPCWIFASVALQEILGFESALYCFMITSRLLTFGLQLARRSPKVRRLLKLKDLPERAVAETQSGFSSYSSFQKQEPYCRDVPGSRAVKDHRDDKKSKERND